MIINLLFLSAFAIFSSHLSANELTTEKTRQIVSNSSKTILQFPCKGENTLVPVTIKMVHGEEHFGIYSVTSWSGENNQKLTWAAIPQTNMAQSVEMLCGNQKESIIFFSSPSQTGYGGNFEILYLSEVFIKADGTTEIILDASALKNKYKFQILEPDDSVDIQPRTAFECEKSDGGGFRFLDYLHSEFTVKVSDGISDQIRCFISKTTETNEGVSIVGEKMIMRAPFKDMLIGKNGYSKLPLKISNVAPGNLQRALSYVASFDRKRFSHAIFNATSNIFVPKGQLDGSPYNVMLRTTLASKPDCSEKTLNCFASLAQEAQSYQRFYVSAKGEVFLDFQLDETKPFQPVEQIFSPIALDHSHFVPSDSAILNGKNFMVDIRTGAGLYGMKYMNDLFNYRFESYDQNSRIWIEAPIQNQGPSLAFYEIQQKLPYRLTKMIKSGAFEARSILNFKRDDSLFNAVYLPSLDYLFANITDGHINFRISFKILQSKFVEATKFALVTFKIRKSGDMEWMSLTSKEDNQIKNSFIVQAAYEIEKSKLYDIEIIGEDIYKNTRTVSMTGVPLYEYKR